MIDYSELSEFQVIDSDPIAMLVEIDKWKQQSKSNVEIMVLDTVIDIIIDNTTWES